MCVTVGHNKKLGNGVAERTQALVPTRTDDGSIPTTGGIFLRAVTVTGEKGRHPPPRHFRYLNYKKFCQTHSLECKNLPFQTPHPPQYNSTNS